jgi:hypothetical protein
VSENVKTSSRIDALEDIIWGFIQDLAKVQALKKRPSLEQRLKVAHAVSQLSASFLKVAEAKAVFSTVPDLQAQLRQLAATNGHADPAA